MNRILTILYLGFRRFLGFGLTLALLAILNLAWIPAFVSASSIDEWGAFATGQSIGAVASTFVAYGWLYSGPAVVAASSPIERLREVRESQRLRWALIGPASAIAATVAATVANADPLFAASGAVTSAFIGLSMNWYFIGRSQPMNLFLFETVPRFAGGAIGVVLLLVGHLNPIWAILCLGIGLVVAPILSTVAIRSGLPRQRVAMRSTAELLRVHRHGVAASISNNLYLAIPLVIVNILIPTGVPLFALVDKVFKQLFAALSVGVDVIQGWVPDVRVESLRDRTTRAAVGGVGLGLLCLLITALIGGRVLELLAAGKVDLDATVPILLGALLSLSLLESIVTRAVLAPLGAIALVARVTIGTAVLGLILVALGAVLRGPEGALFGFASGLGVRVVLLYLYWGLVRRATTEEQKESDSRYGFRDGPT